ncbi:hypothetical protein ABTO23_18820, partial [Acinetobacter baumannii]
MELFGEVEDGEGEEEAYEKAVPKHLRGVPGVLVVARVGSVFPGGVGVLGFGRRGVVMVLVRVVGAIVLH